MVKTDGSNGEIVRQEHGYFGRGNKAASGNGNARRMQHFRRLFLDAIDPETIPALARRLQEEALQGDRDAMKLLFDYVMGKPSQAVELTGEDGAPLGLGLDLSRLADDELDQLRNIAAKLTLDAGLPAPD